MEAELRRLVYRAVIAFANARPSPLPVLGPNVPAKKINVDSLDPKCELSGLVLNTPREIAKVDHILNNSFGMLGINSALIVRRFNR